MSLAAYNLAPTLDLGARGLLSAVLAPQGGADGLAAALLSHFGSLQRLANAEVTELTHVVEVDEDMAVRVRAALALGRLSLRPVASSKPVSSVEDSYAVLSPGLRGLDVEELHALYLDNALQPLALRTLARGTERFTFVDPKSVYRPAVAMRACALIVAHNHPSGDPAPSPQDHEVTRRLVDAGRALGVRLLDHLIIGARGYTSFARRGDIPPARNLPAWIG